MATAAATWDADTILQDVVNHLRLRRPSDWSDHLSNLEVAELLQTEAMLLEMAEAGQDEKRCCETENDPVRRTLQAFIATCRYETRLRRSEDTASTTYEHGHGSRVLGPPVGN